MWFFKTENAAIDIDRNCCSLRSGDGSSRSTKRLLSSMSGGFSTLCFTLTHFQDYYDHDQLRLRAWTESNCQGEIAFTTFDNISFARNISNAYVSRSFKISRPLQGQEQLDISVARELETWFSDKDQLSSNSSSCDHFQQSYFAFNGSTDCHNTPDFTCHRLWINPGL